MGLSLFYSGGLLKVVMSAITLYSGFLAVVVVHKEAEVVWCWYYDLYEVAFRWDGWFLAVR